MHTGLGTLGLLSTLCFSFLKETDLNTSKYLDLAYGSRWTKKAKVSQSKFKKLKEAYCKKVPLFGNTLDNSQ
jgi:hypothetical protein